jgi:SMC interacting uncharacterized protein involved in chromosome segregation
MRSRDQVSELERDLAAERLCHQVSCEGRKRDVRGLEDALEAETEARREAEDENTRLVNEVQDLAMQNAKLRETVRAADYLIDRLWALHLRKPVRDLDEAFVTYRAALDVSHGSRPTEQTVSEA